MPRTFGNKRNIIETYQQAGILHPIGGFEKMLVWPVPPSPRHLCPQHTKTYIHTHNKGLKEISYKEMTINF